MNSEAANAHLARLEQMLAADGCATEWVEMGGERMLVGRRSDFRVRWMATRLHLFVVAAARPSVTGRDVEQFTSAAMEYARAAKGGAPRGLQTGVAVFAALVADQVDASALAAARRQRVAFACFGRPVVIDAATGRAAYYRGRPAVGMIYAGFLRRKADRYFAAASST